LKQEGGKLITKTPSNKPFPPRGDGTSAPTVRLATVREACVYGRFGHTKCYDYINEGKIIAYKRGRRTMIDLDSVDAFHASLERIEPKVAADV
jgi:excisionase family DNA binding protein